MTADNGEDAQMHQPCRVLLLILDAPALPHDFNAQPERTSLELRYSSTLYRQTFLHLETRQPLGILPAVLAHMIYEQTASDDWVLSRLPSAMNVS
jgi:hypothetical protein